MTSGIKNMHVPFIIKLPFNFARSKEILFPELKTIKNHAYNFFFSQRLKRNNKEIKLKTKNNNFSAV